MRIRTGRRNPRALWLQHGEDPNDDVDLFIGSTTTDEAADAIVVAVDTAGDVAPVTLGRLLYGTYLADPASPGVTG